MKTDSEVNEMFSFVFGWDNTPIETQRKLLNEFFVQENLTEADVLFEMQNF